MAKNTIPRGETSVIRHIFIQDSTSTSGAGKTGLAYNTSSLTAYYIYAGSTITALTIEDITTLGTYAAPTSNVHMRFKEIDSTNMPGMYELHFHNDWFSIANNRKTAVLQLKGATGMAPVNLEFDVIGFGLQSATPDINVAQISGDDAAANNAESFFDGTGYAGTNNVIPTVTNLTNAPSDSSGVTTLLSRHVGTIAAGTHNPQSGDSYAIVNSGTYGNNALKTLIDTVDTVADGIEVHVHQIDSRVLGTVAAGTHNPQSGDSYAIVNSGTYGNNALKTLIDTVDNYVDTEISTITTELAKVPKSDGSASWNSTALTAIATQATAALQFYDPPTNTEMVAAFTEIKGATWSASTDTLEAIRDRGDSAWVTATGFALASVCTEVRLANLDATISSRAPSSTALSNLVWTDTKAGYIDTTISSRSTLDAAGIRTAIGMATANLDTQIADLPTVSEFNARTIAADDYLVVSDISGLATTSELSFVSSQVSAVYAVIDTEVAAIKAKTDQLVFVDSKVNANATATVDVEAIDTQLSGTHGSGSWGSSGSFIIPTLHSSIYNTTVSQARVISIIQGDTPTLTFDLEENYTGYTGYFAAKRNYTDLTYMIAPVTISWVDASLGTGSFTLTSDDTSTTGVFHGEIELRKDDTRYTVLQCTLKVLPQIIT